MLDRLQVPPVRVRYPYQPSVRTLAECSFTGMAGTLGA